MVEPAGNAVRAVAASGATDGTRLLVVGPGTIGLLCAMFATSQGANVALLGNDEPSIEFAAGLGFTATGDQQSVVTDRWDAVIDASTGHEIPGWAVTAVRPGGRVVLVGLSARPSQIDTRALVHAEVSVVGILGGSSGTAAAVEAFASGAADPRPLVAETIGLDDLDDELAGRRRREPGRPPKTHVDPAR